MTKTEHSYFLEVPTVITGCHIMQGVRSPVCQTSCKALCGQTSTFISFIGMALLHL